MSAIRPLATIAILTALGVFLAIRIQQDPLAPTASVDNDWGQAPAFGDPGGTAAPMGGEAPAFGGPAMGDAPSFSDPPAFPPPVLDAPSTSPATIPAMPTIPEMPALPNNPAAAPVVNTPPAQPTAVDPNELNLPDLPLPANIPQANYGAPTNNAVPPAGAAPPAGPASNFAEGISGRVPSLGTATPDYQALGAAAQPTETASAPTSAPVPTSVPVAAMPEAIPAAPTSGYATARPAIQVALNNGELTRAHLLLSQWYGDPGLSVDERSEVDRLLGQLAGSVVYSKEHRLEPPHQVQAGESLETIAKQYGVPWQLLAKINGISRSDAVQPGQILKVIKGPFSAVVDVSDGELVLTIGDRYAGRFPVQIDLPVGDSETLEVAKSMYYKPTSMMADSNGYTRSIELFRSNGSKIVLGAESTPGAGNAPQIAVASNDLLDLYDILSNGSEVTIRK